MNQSKRVFFKHFGTKAAAAATVTAIPVGTYIDSLKGDIAGLSKQFSSRLDQTQAVLGSQYLKLSESVDETFEFLKGRADEQYRYLSNRMDAAALNMTYQQMQLHLILLLLLLSFVIDGGMALTWYFSP